MGGPGHHQSAVLRSGQELPLSTIGPEWLSSLFAALFGAFLGLALLKYGNPPIMEDWVSAPTQFYEYVFGFPWPANWGYCILGFLALLGLAVARWRRTAPKWLVALPLAWLIWECIAGTQSVNAALTNATLKHFAACVICFYLGFFSLSRSRNPWLWWTGLLCGLLLVLQVGWDQHFGGLQATRRYFYAYVYGQMKVPPEYLRRISSSRIFATLFYPNALAGLLLLILPGALGMIWDARRRLTAPARGFLMLALAALGLACLYWSGSKGGWLLMLLLGLLVLLRLPFDKQLKRALVAAVLVAGLVGFFWKYASFFEKGATSVGARFDYWRAALQTAGSHPVFGTGPGTFAVPYAAIKRPESEMARLVHDDYLEQASDSGVLGFAAYTLFITGAIVWTFRRGLGGNAKEGWVRFAAWVGVLGWCLQGLVDFALYIPASAWLAFTLLGWLMGTAQITSTSASQAPSLPAP